MISDEQIELEAESHCFVISLSRTERKKLEMEILSNPKKYCGDRKTYVLKRSLIGSGFLRRGFDINGNETLRITDMGRSYLRNRLQ